MIVYDLSCEKAHRFEGWFSSAEDFDTQVQADQVSCPVCGSVSISRQLSAPYVNTGSPEPDSAAKSTSETAVAGVDIASLHRKFVEYVLKSSEDVGKKFPEEARKIHYEEEPRRSIRGQASSDEIEALRDEGIDIFQVPGLPVPPDQVH
ncbi:MAG TPA: DUF1178 family protein [Burkholderiales bacterium]|nr:DUF1178 family protein [Burkholderiales bacterium]